MKILKRLLVVGILLVVVLVAAVWLFFSPIVSSAIEKGTTYATGVDTKVKSVSASPTAGKFSLEGLRMANPPGFRDEPFVQLGNVRAAWQNGTLLSDTIGMDEFVVENVEVNLERAGSGTNYGWILDHLSKISGEKPPEKEKEPEPAKGKKTLRIKRIEIRNVHAGLHLSGIPLASGSTSVTVPSIVIDDFRSDGSTTEIVGKLTGQVIHSILDSVLKAGKDVFPADVVKDLGGSLKKVGDAIGAESKGSVQGIQDALKGAGDLFKKK
jgi:hypothetical protein